MKRWLVLLVCCLVTAAATAQVRPGEIAIGAEDHYGLSRAFLFLEDPTGQLTLADLLMPQVQQKFQPLPQGGPGANFGFTRSAIWLRVSLAAARDTPADWLLELAYPPLNRLELYVAGAAGFERQLGGNLQPFDSRPIAHRSHVLPVKLRPGAQTIIYLRLESQGTVSAPVTLWRPAALWRYDQASYSLLSLYFGLLIGLLLYNLLLFLSVRDVGYLIYVAFVASMGLGLAALTGLGTQFLWPRWTWWNSISPPVGLAAAAVFGTQFARHFLASPVRMPGIDRLMRALLAGWFLAIVAAFALPYRVSTWMITALAVISVVTMLAVGAISLRRQFAGARYFCAAWAVLLLGVATLALHNSGWLPSNAFTANALLIGSAFEMVLLSFALADRINVARRFKEQAQARIRGGTCHGRSIEQFAGPAAHAAAGARDHARELDRRDRVPHARWPLPLGQPGDAGHLRKPGPAQRFDRAVLSVARAVPARRRSSGRLRSARRGLRD
jgi:hypothetical protein